MFHDLLFGLSIMLSFITALLLLFRVDEGHVFSIRLLAAYLLMNAYSFSFYLFIKYGVLTYFPFLYKTPVPLGFLLPAVAYLYVRSTLKNETNFQKTDVWHLLPFSLAIINYIPFYFMPLSEKRSIVNAVVTAIDNVYFVQDGLVSEWLVLIVQLLLGFIYLAFQWKLLLGFFKVQPTVQTKSYRTVKKWLFDFVKLQTFYSISLVLIYLINTFLFLSWFGEGNFAVIASRLLISISFLFLSGYLLWNPKVLVGLPRFKGAVLKQHTTEPLQQADSILQKISSEQLFLQEQLTLTRLAQQLGVPPRKLSGMIKASGKGNFNDYINSLRVAHAEGLMAQGYLKKHAIEVLGKASGFRSKNAFYRAFKKEYGCTPKNYDRRWNQNGN